MQAQGLYVELNFNIFIVPIALTVKLIIDLTLNVVGVTNETPTR
jgi:hypothetical protein